MSLLLAFGVYAQTPDDFVTPEFKKSRTLELIRAQYAYAAGYTGKGIIIAIVDSGLDIHHPEFAGRVSSFRRNYLPGFGPYDVYSGLDEENHGTHVTGLAAAARDGKGMHGVAYNATVLPLRTDFDDEQMVHVFDQAIRAGAKVLNGSYGPPLIWDANPLDPNRLPSAFHPVLPDVDAEYLLLKRAADADILMVYAAGNERAKHPGPYTNMPSGAAMFPLITPGNTKLKLDDKYFYRFFDDLPDFGPAKFLGDAHTDAVMWTKVQEFDFSSLKGSLIAVVATRPDGVIANYSNLCGAAARWCLAAPGGEYSDTDPDDNTNSVLSTLPYGSYGYQNGTSMASPVVAGAAAVMREAFPYMTARQVIEIMLTSADNTTNPEWKKSLTYGRGMLDLGTAINGPVVFGDSVFDPRLDPDFVETSYPTLDPFTSPISEPVFSVNTQGYDSVWRNNIVGTGGMKKAGAGTLTMTGANTYTGETTIVGGKLMVNGSIQTSSLLHIGSDAVLGGSGKVGKAEVYGRVAPGNSVGRLKVIGDYTQYAGSVFELELDESGGSDFLEVTGKADIQAGSELEVLGLHANNIGQAFSFIEADSWEGTGKAFSSVRLGRAFIDLSSVWTATGMTLAVKRNATTFASLGRSQNQSALATAIESQGVGGLAFNDMVILRNAGDAPDLYDALAGEVYASTAAALLDVGDGLSRTALQRFRLGSGVRGNGNAGGNTQLSANGRAVWGQALGSWGQLGGSTQTYALNRSTQGLMFGVDTLFTDNVKAGVAVGYTNSSFKGRSGDSAQADGYHALAYGDARSGPLSLRGGVGYSWYSVNTRRAMNYANWGTATSRAQAQSTQAFAEVAYAQPISAITLEPYAGLAYVHLRQQGFKEADSPVGLQSDASSAYVSYSTLGVRALWDLETNGSGNLQAVVGLGWRHALSGSKVSRELSLATGDAYRANGTPLAKNALVTELGVEWSSSTRSRIRLNYTGQVAGRTRDHGIQARASWAF